MKISKTAQVIIWSVSGLVVIVGGYFGFKYFTKPVETTKPDDTIPTTEPKGKGEGTPPAQETAPSPSVEQSMNPSVLVLSAKNDTIIYSHKIGIIPFKSVKKEESVGRITEDEYKKQKDNVLIKVLVSNSNKYGYVKKSDTYISGSAPIGTILSGTDMFASVAQATRNMTFDFD